MDVYQALALGLGAAVLLLLGWISTARGHYNAKLPPGDSGSFFSNDSLTFATVGPYEFLRPKIKKYGRVFRTRLFGQKVIVATTPEVSQIVHNNPGNHFVSGFAESAKYVFGITSLPFSDGPPHNHIHKWTQNLLFYDNISPRIPEIEKYMLDRMVLWENKTVLLQAELKKITLSISMHMMVGFGIEEDEKLIEQLLDLFAVYITGVYAVNINIPGTTFYKAMQARKKLADIIIYFIEVRKKRLREGCVPDEEKDFLTRFIEFKDIDGKHLTNDELNDQVIALLFAGFDTTSASTALGVDLLMQHPDVYLKLKKESMEIVQSKRTTGEPEHLTLADLKKMKYSSQVIHETLRYGGVMMVRRRATKDLEVAGHLIPKGWTVMVPYSTYHQDPAYWDEPAIFEPGRFQDQVIGKNFTPFGAGGHICPGREFAKVLMKIFYHHLIVKYKWRRTKAVPGLAFFPIAYPKDQLPIKLVPLAESDVH